MHHHDPWAGQSHIQSGSFLLNHLWVTAPKQTVSIPKTNEFTLFWITLHSTLEISPLGFIFVIVLHNAWEVSHHRGPSTLVPSSAIPQESGFGVGHVACSVGMLVTAAVAARDMGRSRRGRRSNWDGNNFGNVGKRPLQGCSQSLQLLGNSHGRRKWPSQTGPRGGALETRWGRPPPCSPPLLRCETNISDMPHPQCKMSEHQPLPAVWGPCDSAP